VSAAAAQPASPADPRRERIGLIFVALCALVNAFTAPFAKLNTNLADASFVSAASVLLGALFAAGQLAWRGDLKLIVRRDLAPRFAAVGLFGTAIAFLLYFEGSQRSTAIETALCVQSEPAYSMLLAWLVFGHRPTLARVLATLAIMLGIATAVGLEHAGGSTGVLILLAAPLAWQISHLIVLRELRGVHPDVLTGGRYVYGSVFLVLLWLLRGGLDRLPPAELWPQLVPQLAVQGIVLGWGGTLLWYHSITRLDLNRVTSIVVPSIPLLSFCAGFLLLGETPSARQWLGLAITGAGVIAFVRAQEPARAT